MPNPLYKKLGIKEGFLIKPINQPEDYYLYFDEFPDGVEECENPMVPKDFVHYFAQCKVELASDFPLLLQEIKQNGMIWISWIKQSAKIPTDLDGNFVREMGLSTGLVDCKVCSINEKWSAMKFVIRLKDRTK